ncbi:hypothetical protein C8J57DRAFT_1074829, partial [Mycena rebaudengoi]
AAPVVFIQVKGHSGNVHNDSADVLAKQGARKPRVANYATNRFLARGIYPAAAAGIPGPKVSYRPLPKPTKVGKTAHASTSGDQSSALTAHRGRPELIEMQRNYAKNYSRWRPRERCGR